MSRRAALVTLALALEAMCVLGRPPRLPETRSPKPAIEIVAVEKPKNRPTA